jgi:hypothetical protein
MLCGVKEVGLADLGPDQVSVDVTVYEIADMPHDDAILRTCCHHRFLKPYFLGEGTRRCTAAYLPPALFGHLLILVSLQKSHVNLLFNLLYYPKYP